MDWYSVEAIGNNEQERLNVVVNELFNVQNVLQSYRHVYTDEQKRDFEFNHDAVSYHAAKMHNGRVMALVILERHYKDGIVYRPYTEEDSPGQFLCPKSILDKLSPTQNHFAIEWRNKAYRINRILYVEKQAAQLARYGKEPKNKDRGISM